jgi:hypothetical protein
LKKKSNELKEIENDLEIRFDELLEKTEEFLKPVTAYFETYFV